MEVLKIAATAARTEDDRRAGVDAARMITTKVWAELGDLLDGEERGEPGSDDEPGSWTEGFAHPRPRSGSVSAAATPNQLLFAGELDGGPCRDGMVYFDEASIEAYLERHRYGVMAEPSTGSSTGRAETGGDVGAAGVTGTWRTPSSKAQEGMDENGSSGDS